jgi:ABC-type glycerol-3-phosphate transport system permease component
MKNRALSEWLFQTVVIFIFTLFVLLCIYPFYYILVYSLSNPQSVGRVGLLLWPIDFTLGNYKQIFGLSGFLSSFIVSALRAIIGTAVTILFSSMLAYTLTKERLPGRKIFYRVTVISMYLSAGLIPWYIVMIKIGMQNNPLLYILPYAVTVYFLILIKTYIEQLPASLEESAVLDGAGYFTSYFRIVLPLCKPILAAVAVFSAVNQWNSWTDNFFLVDAKNLQTLQLTLLTFLNQADSIAQQMATSGGNAGVLSGMGYVKLSPMSIRMTMTMVVAIPIILVYPFMQRFFVKGILLGAVKG